MLVLLALVVGVVTGRYATSTATDAAALGWRPVWCRYYTLAYVCHVAALRQGPAAVEVSVLPLIPVGRTTRH